MTAITGRPDVGITILAPPDLARHALELGAAQKARSMFRKGEPIVTS
jgi:hypothetical protein